jgi:carboxypeptidase Q
MTRKTLVFCTLTSALLASDALAQAGRGGRGGPPGPTPPPTNAQALPVDRATAPYVRSTPPTEPMIQKIFEEGMQRSQVMKIAQTLLDSIGPRLTGSVDADRAQAYMVSSFKSWGIPARIENYGTWNSWKNGAAFGELLFPRVRGLEITAMGWSPGTKGKWVEGAVVVIPRERDHARAVHGVGAGSEGQVRVAQCAAALVPHAVAVGGVRHGRVA